MSIQLIAKDKGEIERMPRGTRVNLHIWFHTLDIDSNPIYKVEDFKSSHCAFQLNEYIREVKLISAEYNEAKYTKVAKEILDRLLEVWGGELTYGCTVEETIDIGPTVAVNQVTCPRYPYKSTDDEVNLSEVTQVAEITKGLKLDKLDKNLEKLSEEMAEMFGVEEAVAEGVTLPWGNGNKKGKGKQTIH